MFLCRLKMHFLIVLSVKEHVDIAAGFSDFRSNGGSGYESQQNVSITKSDDAYARQDGEGVRQHGTLMSETSRVPVCEFCSQEIR